MEKQPQKKHRRIENNEKSFIWLLISMYNGVEASKEYINKMKKENIINSKDMGGLEKTSKERFDLTVDADN